MDSAETKKIANDWVEAWNKRDLTKVMEHYADDCELHSPFVVKRWNLPNGNIRGKEKMKEHFAKAFEGPATKSMELLEILTGVGEFLLIFGDKQGPTSANLVALDESGKVKTVKAFYR